MRRNGKPAPHAPGRPAASPGLPRAAARNPAFSKAEDVSSGLQGGRPDNLHGGTPTCSFNAHTHARSRAAQCRPPCTCPKCTHTMASQRRTHHPPSAREKAYGAHRPDARTHAREDSGTHALNQPGVSGARQHAAHEHAARSAGTHLGYSGLRLVGKPPRVLPQRRAVQSQNGPAAQS